MEEEEEEEAPLVLRVDIWFFIVVKRESVPSHTATEDVANTSRSACMRGSKRKSSHSGQEPRTPFIETSKVR